jgi:hypothetical protein
MKQSRVTAGQDMELSVLKDGWVKSATKPKLKWRVEGKNNIQKIINSNYDPKQFSVLENITLNKYDIYNPKTKKQREVKSYNISEVSKWTLYSEPYFKISTRGQLNKITQEVYNDFLQRFYTHANDTGLLKFIQEQMICSNEGIVFKDGFIPKEQLEFRTVIVNKQWKGYDRIQIQFRITN